MATGGKQPSPLGKFCEAMKCRTCKKYPKTPKTLQCLHTFCEECLARYVDTLPDEDGRKRSLPCPACGMVQNPPLDDADVTRIKTNFCFENFLRHEEREAARAADPGEARCDRCNRRRRPVDTFCTVCRVGLCDACVEDHKVVPSTADHDLVPKNASAGQHGRWRCGKLTNEAIEPCMTQVQFYCDECGVVMCTACRLTDHTSHPTRTALDAYRNQGHRASIEQKSVEVEQIEKRFVATIKEIENLKKRLSGSMKNAETAIDRKTAELHEALEEEKRSLKRTAKVILDNKTAKCDEQIQALADIHERFRHSLNITHTTLQIGEAEDVLFMERMLIKGLQSLSELYCDYDHTPCEDDVIHFTENSQANIKGALGTVMTSAELFIPGLKDRVVDTQFYADNL